MLVLRVDFGDTLIIRHHQYQAEMDSPRELQTMTIPPGTETRHMRGWVHFKKEDWGLGSKVVNGLSLA